MSRTRKVIEALKKAKPYFHAATTVMAYGADMVEKKNIFSTIRFVSGCTDELLNFVDMDEGNVPSTWHQIMPRWESALFDEALHTLPTRRGATSSLALKTFKTTVGKFEVHLTESFDQDYRSYYLDMPERDEDRITAARDAMRAYARQFVPRRAVMLINSVGNIGMTPVIAEQIDTTFHLTSVAVSEARRIRRYLDKDMRRSIMFFGPPGYGKTNLARSITEFLSLRSLEISADTLNMAHSYGMVERLISAIGAVGPDILVLNDVDRTEKGRVFPFMDKAKQVARVVLYTSNTLGGFDTAMRRPERVDEFVPVKRLEEDVIRTILGKHVSLLKQVRTWPAAYIAELRTRIDVEGPDRIPEWVEELGARQNEGITEYGHENAPGEKKAKPRAKKKAATTEAPPPADGVRTITRGKRPQGQPIYDESEATNPGPTNQLVYR